MALIDKASLLMVPSVYEDGTLYNVLPSGNKAPDETGNHNGYDQTRADFTFSRGFNLTATRVNANGLIEKGRENKILGSNDFNGIYWVRTSVTLTSGQSGFDGTNNAWLFDSSAGFMYSTSIISGVATFSVYAKKGTAQGIRMRVDAGTDANCYIDLENGSEISAHSGVALSVADVGNGWYRIAFSYNDPSVSNVRFYAIDSGGVSTSGSIYIQNAQLEYGLAASSYLDSGATTATAGVLENTPRIDYSSGAGALLLEPLRSNLMTNSEYTGAYLKANITATSNEATSPEGVNNATKIQTTDTGQCHMRAAFSASTGNYTGSVFVKKQDFDYIYMEMGGAYAWFNINTGVKGNGNNYGSDWTYVDHSIEDYGNGWYRCILIGNCLTAGAYTFRSIQPVAGNGLYNSNLSGGVTYWFGAQCEAASHVSSYVPTYGSAATRGADSCSVTGVSDVIGQTEGTLYYDWIMNHESPNTSEDLYTLTLSDGSGNKMIAINNYNNILAVFIIDTTTQFSDNSYAGGADGARIKLALAYANNDIALYINGTQIATDSSATIPTLNQVRLNAFWSGGAQDNTSVKQLALFNERLTNEELATLTTL